MNYRTCMNLKFQHVVYTIFSTEQNNIVLNRPVIICVLFIFTLNNVNNSVTDRISLYQKTKYETSVILELN